MSIVADRLGALGRAIGDRIASEPVMALGVVQAALSLAVGFGLRWTGEQVGLVVALSAAVLSFVARQRVTPA